MYSSLDIEVEKYLVTACIHLFRSRVHLYSRILGFQSLVKRMKHPSFIMHFGKPIEDEWWLGVGLGRCDR